MSASAHTHMCVSVCICVSVLLSVYRPMQDGKFIKHMRKQNAEKVDRVSREGFFGGPYKVAPPYHLTSPGVMMKFPTLMRLPEQSCHNNQRRQTAGPARVAPFERS